MNELDIAIQTINNNICKNIAESLDRGFLSQNILSQMRNFVEHISLKLYCADNKCDMSLNYDNLKIGNNHVRSNSKYIFYENFVNYCKFQLLTILWMKIILRDLC